MSVSVVLSRSTLRRRSRQFRRRLLGAVALGSVVLLAACSSEEPVARPTATTTVAVTTTKATAEDLAFHEAEAVYRRHIALLDELSRSGGDAADIERLGETSTGVDKATWENWYREVWPGKHWRLASGALVVRDVKLTKAQLDRDPPQLHVVACLDASSAIVVDSSNAPVRKPGSPSMSRENVTIVQDNSGAWKVSHSTNKLVKTC
jgi:hypothetical protein